MKKYLKKEQLPLYIVGIISLVVVGFVVNYTYSFFAVNKTNNNVIAGEAESMSIDLKVEKKAPNNDNKLVPQLDEYITSAVKGVNGSCVDGNNNNVCQVYKITVKNGGSTTTQLNGEVVLDAKNNPNLKWAVISGEATSGAKPTLKSNVYKYTHKALTTKEEYTGGQIKEYYIVVWISETGLGQEDTGKFTGVVNFKNINDGSGDWGTTSIDNSGANAPAYTEGLIPVMYDESRSTWVKADTTSSESEYAWYDYDNKKWANAVLVKDNTLFGVLSASVKESNKNVNIDTLVYSTSGSMDGIDSEITFTFTTGNSGGTLSFDYFSKNYDGAPPFEILLNNNTIVSVASNDYQYSEDSYMYSLETTNYSTQLQPNTDYTMFISYNSGWNFGDLNIANFTLPSDLSVPLSVTSTEDCPWNISNKVRHDSSYTINNDYKFVLESASYSAPTIDAYICSDGVSTICDEIYLIKETDGNKITVVDSYVVSGEGTITRETLKNAEAGTEIPEETILAYYVWIPRYKYKVWNKDKVIGVDVYNAETKGIDIIFENGTSTTGDVTCTYDFSKTATDTVRNEECTGTNGVSYYTHPAFTFGDDELTGFWMGKYEISSTKQSCNNEYDSQCSGGDSNTLTPRILPNVFNWSYNSLDNYSIVIKNMQVSNNIYGLSTDLTVADSHMITNMEWGAMAYLTNSDYGLCANDKCSSMGLSFSYNSGEAGITGTGDSTTKNIYGIYDVYGGAEEYVMSGESTSSLGKYITTYVSGNTLTDQTAFNRMRLGDAVGEVISVNLNADPDYGLGDGTDGWDGRPNGWYSSYINASSRFTMRRGCSSGSMGCGYIFDEGSAAGADEFMGTRASLVVFP